MYEFYEDMLDRKDIDVIEIATPDHWHALVAIHACHFRMQSHSCGQAR